MGRITVPAARTRVHRCDEQKMGGIRQGLTHARNGDGTTLEGLAQDLQDIPVELGQLVHEQDTTVGERDLTRARRGSSADDGNTGCRVVRVPERALFYHGLSVHQQAGGAVDGRDPVSYTHLTLPTIYSV